MKKFLIGLPVCIIGLFLFLLPGIIFGEIGMQILSLIILIVSFGLFSYVIGEEILEKKENRNE